MFLKIDVPIPDNWEYNKKEDIVDGYYSLVDVTNQQEIDEIKNIPELNGLTISKLQRIQNWNLYRRYQIRKAEVTAAVKKYQPNTQVERRLFHGTAKNNVASICKSGFDRDYSGTAAGKLHLFVYCLVLSLLLMKTNYCVLPLDNNHLQLHTLGSVHETGTYFAIKAQLSRRYGKSLLLVRVLTGISIQSSGSTGPNLSTIPGSQSERIHSVVDEIDNPTMYVVSNDNSAYPEYVLHVSSR